MKTKIMGILNITPNSCYDQGKYFHPDKALKRAHELIHLGADVLDIGGESTWIESAPVPLEEELNRVLPIIEALNVPVPISIDTFKPQVAAKACEKGASIINDITGFSQEEMIDVAKTYQTDLVVMHMLGTPQTMQIDPHYPEGVMEALMTFFEQRCDTLLQKGIKREKIWLDPGIGFGKTVADNLTILQNLQKLRSLGFPLLLGTSRKSFMMKILNVSREKLLPATLCVNILAVLDKVEMLRVHDVEEHKMVVNLLYEFKNFRRVSTRD